MNLINYILNWFKKLNDNKSKIENNDHELI